MKLLSTIHNLNNLNLLLNNSDGLVVGLKGFSTRETSFLTVEEFTLVSTTAKSLNKELYISLKPMLYNSYVEGLVEVFKKIKELYYTGVIVGDIGYYYLLSEIGINNIIYNPETLLTNIGDFNSYFEVGVKGAFVAKEINLNDVVLIADHKKGKTFIVAHGHLNMFYSKRKLLESYFKNVNVNYEFLDKTTLTLEEANRRGKYPIIEDKFGTHVFRENISSVIKHLEYLKDIDYFLIDSLFKDDLYAVDILKMFKLGYQIELAEKLMNKYKEKWDDGFLSLKTIYKKDEES